MQSRDTEVSAGQILAGKYRIERVLGRGGMGVVVSARHIQLDEQVALKFLLPDALANQDAVRRFEREARAAVKIKSEHVARVTDVGTLESGSPYMVMEYLNGKDLGDYLAQLGPLPLEESVEYVLQACEAIAEAHSMGIIHRDLKPANLFRIVRADGTPSIKVLDFGISKVQGDHAMTHTSSMMGSPQYMSPEQMTAAKSVDVRADIWAMGVILLELLSGKAPFDGDTIPELCVAILNSEPPPLSRLRPELPIEVGVVIERALKKNREDRFANVAEFATALASFGPPGAAVSAERIRRVLGVNPERGARTLLVGTGPTVDDARPRETGATMLAGESPLGSTFLDASNTRPHPPTRSKTPLYAAAAVGILLLGGGAVWLSGSSPAEPAVEAKDASPAAAAPVPAAVPAPEPAPAAPPPPAVTPAPPVTPEPAPATTKVSTTKKVTKQTSASPGSSTPTATSPAATTPAATTPAKTSPSKSLFSDRK